MRRLTAGLLAFVTAAGALAGCSRAGTGQAVSKLEESRSVSGEVKDAQESIKTSADKLKEMGIQIEDTDLTGEFTYWSGFTGDSKVWDQSRVDAFNELYKDKGIKCNVQFVPEGAGIDNGKLLSAIA